MTGIELITKERDEQINKHGYGIENDRKYKSGELILLVEYLIKVDEDAEKNNYADILESDFGFANEFLNKLRQKRYIEQLTVAGATIAAEIDRLQDENSL